MALVEEIAQTIIEGFDKHYRLFRETSRAAKERFEKGDWEAVQEASRERIQMYDARVGEAVAALTERFDGKIADESIWPSIKQAYIGLLYDHLQPECAETFYNSVACQVLHRRYYKNQYIFWRPAVSTEHLSGSAPTYQVYYPATQGLEKTVADMVAHFDLKLPFQNLRRDVGYLIRAVKEHFGADWTAEPNFQLQVLSSLFYRNKAAYLVGRTINGNHEYPFVLPILQNEKRELYLDTALLKPADIGRLFSLTRAYFMADMEVPAAYVTFLRALMPTKSRAELYTVLGLQKQGKTLFYRDLFAHLAHSTDNFGIAPGVKGMVMIVFTLPSFPYVFKLIRDWFDRPKDIDPATVKEKYLTVKYHDRVGRMADTLEYSHVAFPRNRFSQELVDELQKLAPSSIQFDGDQLVIKHLYIERRMEPLDIYLSHADEAHTRAAVRDYGNAIRELAAANIFPGDLLPKNFGVTRYGRVVFYDYDEICPLTEVNFRRLPQASSYDDEVSGEPWYSVDAKDVFPEEFPTFLFATAEQRELFRSLHPDLGDPAAWIAQQDRIKAHIQDDVFPYAQELRFSRRYGHAAHEAS